MKQLSVLHINKFHYLRGGSEVVYFETADILEKHGHRSVFFSMRHPNNLPCETSEYFVPYIDLERERAVANYLRASGKVLYSFEAKRLLSKLLEKYTVDIVHIHNIHRQMSPSILHELKKRGIPVVMTLHEYKMICPSFRMLFHEKPCEACAGGRYFNTIKLRCIKDSYLRSALASIENYLHHKVLDIYKNVDIFISPSLFLKKKHEEMGFKKEIVHLPNCVDIQKLEKFKFNAKREKEEKRISIVYFGRLVPHKGLFTLLEAVKLLSHKNINKEVEFKLIGDGPIKEELQEEVKAKGINNVRFLGYMKDETLYQEIKKSLAAVLPSEWYENNPMSIIEAFALGMPVISARIGGIPELVKDNETGLIFESGNPENLSSKIEYLVDNPDKAAEMGKNARAFVEEELNAEKHYEKLIGIYKQAGTGRC